MIDELVDLCDDNGKIIGSIEKKKAHATGAWHKAVHVYLVNDKNELLMQLRTPNKDIAPNVWDISVGGHVDAGEPTLTTAARETEEELGVHAKESEFKYLFTNKEILQNDKYISREFVDVYLIRKNVSEEDITLQECEVAEFRFVPLKEFFAKVATRDEKFTFHTQEYDKIIPMLRKEVFKEKY